MNQFPVRGKFTTAQRLHKTGQRAGALALYQRILGGKFKAAAVTEGSTTLRAVFSRNRVTSHDNS